VVDDSEFITKLIGFGLSEKEAQLYLHLLKCGPKPPSLLAKSIKTYREDVYRTLNSLIDKGMVNPSLESPTVYAAVELELALDSALKRHETELREMERRKQELREISEQQWFGPSDEVSTFKIIKSVKELTAATISALMSVEEELLWVVPEGGIIIASLFGVTDAAKNFINRGGKIRGIIDIQFSAIEAVKEILDVGEDVRHFDNYRGIIFGVFDRKICASAIKEAAGLSPNSPVSMLWTEDPTYAQYLVSTFELLWKQSVPARQRIEELLNEGPPQA
jgi:sugar-specific transcriptional regulator TrmB